MKPKPKLGELLVAAGVIDAEQLQAALGEQRQWGKPLGMTLVQLGMLDEDTLVQALASQLKLPVVKLAGKRVNPEVLARVPHSLAKRHRCIPLLVNDEGGQEVLYLGMEDPSDLDVLDEIGFRAGTKVKPVLVAPGELEEALAHAERWKAAAASPSQSEGPAPEFAEIDSSDPFAPIPATPTVNEEPPVATGGSPAVDSQSAILRALSQLLVEKGIITRDELVDRVRAVMRES